NEGVVALSGCRDGEIARRLRAGDREGARMVAEGFAALFGRADARAQGGPRGMASAGFFLELEHHLLPDDDWLVAETARLAEEVGLPVVVTNDVHYAHRAGRELHDVVTAIRHGRTLDGLADLRDPSGELYLKSAEELAVIEKTGLAEFFLICWDLMRFAKQRGIPAQGRGSAADSIVAYVLGITRVDPIRHNLLFERFINEGRTAYPDVDIDFSAARREEVIQYVYARYGEEHTGMVCNLVTYRARSAVREVGYALGFPRPLVHRV